MLPDLSIEAAYEGLVAGVDEAGRGSWAGPVVAAVVILDIENLPSGINDSKKLSAKKRDFLYDEILRVAKSGVGMASVEEIDSLNILQATMLAMQRAVNELAVMPNVALIDGNKAPKLACKTVTIIGGDAKSLSIAAASIIAKASRDRIMASLAVEYPGYSWESNAGYGTVSHQQGLKMQGITLHHRKSYAPIRAIIEQNKAA